MASQVARLLPELPGICQHKVTHTLSLALHGQLIFASVALLDSLDTNGWAHGMNSTYVQQARGLLEQELGRELQ
jgi:hypothetical protein